MLPLIPGVILATSAIAGAFGAKNAYDAKKTNDKIKEIKKYIEKKDRQTLNLFQKAVYRVQSKVDEVNTIVQEVYQIKLPLLAHSFSFIKNLQYSLDEANIDVPDFDLRSLNKDIDEIKEIVLGVGKSVVLGASSGAAASYGVVALVTTFGVASTGTAISSLSGIAAQNAILAFLGGGSIAAGGGGIALGSIVLGSLVVAPAVLVGSYTIKKTFEKNFEKLKQVKVEAETIFSERENSAKVLNKFADVMVSYKKFMVNLSEVIDKEILKVKEIIESYGIDANYYSENTLNNLVNTYKVMDIAVKTAKIPPLSESGDINKHFVDSIKAYSNELSALA